MSAGDIYTALSRGNTPSFFFIIHLPVVSQISMKVGEGVGDNSQNSISYSFVANQGESARPSTTESMYCCVV